MTPKKAKTLMKLHGHKFGYCSQCGSMIRCGYCGNNCCNGGSREECKDNCDEADAIQNVIKYPLSHNESV